MRPRSLIQIKLRAARLRVLSNSIGAVPRPKRATGIDQEAWDTDMIFTARKAAVALCLVLALATAVPAIADSGNDMKTIGNVTIYLGLIPAEMIRGHPPNHPESTMHGTRPPSRNEYHVLIALFDATTGARIAKARVTARVSEVGLLGEEKALQPMEIAGTETYGNYFPMNGDGPFTIKVTIHVPGQTSDIVTQFEHRHQ